MRLKDILSRRGHSVDIQEIIPVKEHSIWYWFFVRHFKGKCLIKEPNIKDVSGYDVICFGSPNWTRISLPLARYIEMVKGMEYKKVGFFATTFLWPSVEWLLVSGFLLEFTFFRAIKKARTRLIAKILLSSFFKEEGVESQKGKRKITEFCDDLEEPILDVESFTFRQREFRGSRSLIITLSSLLLLGIGFQIVTGIFGALIFSWFQFLQFFLVWLIVWIVVVPILRGKKRAYLGKYFAPVLMTALWTFVVTVLPPSLARITIYGYIFIFMIMIFFQSAAATAFSVGISILSYFYLYFLAPEGNVLLSAVDTVFLVLGGALMTMASWKYKSLFSEFTGMKEEAETAEQSLEIRVKARTKELKELSEQLEEKVKERTKTLQDKVNELKKFHKLTVGREEKMIEMKKEIKELKEKLEERKKGEKKRKEEKEKEEEEGEEDGKEKEGKEDSTNKS